MGLRRARRARRAHASDGPAWNLKPGTRAWGFRGGHSTGVVRAGDWVSRPTGMLGVKSHHVACGRVKVPMFAGLPSSDLRTVHGVGRHAKARFRILKNQASAS